MAQLNPTSPAHLIDKDGRPYFLWDCNLTLTEFEKLLRDPDINVRAYYVAKLMRQAKPDDVFTFLSTQEVMELWPSLRYQLGKEAPFWDWLIGLLEKHGLARH